MTNLLWMAVIVALLGGHGLLRGYSPTVSKTVVLAALGVVIACLATIGGWWAWTVNAMAMLACVLLAFHDEGRPRDATRSSRRASASRITGLRQATPRAATPARRRRQTPPSNLRRGA
ncbi:hypothetical protein [Halotalea alkalilenta]|nr:hypothetical protein [Halotalea alkalilenta]